MPTTSPTMPIPQKTIMPSAMSGPKRPSAFFIVAHLPSAGFPATSSHLTHKPSARRRRAITREGPILTRSYTAHRPSISNTRSSIEIALLFLDSRPRDEDRLLDLGPRGGLVRVRGRAYEDTDAFMKSPAG